jgi:hypothetical protein
MFQTLNNNETNNELTISEHSSKGVKSFLRLLYDPTLSRAKCPAEVFGLASTYRVASVAQTALTTICRVICQDTFLQTVRFAEAHHLGDVKMTAFEWFASHKIEAASIPSLSAGLGHEVCDQLIRYVLTGDSASSQGPCSDLPESQGGEQQTQEIQQEKEQKDNDHFWRGDESGEESEEENEEDEDEDEDDTSEEEEQRGLNAGNDESSSGDGSEEDNSFYCGSDDDDDDDEEDEEFSVFTETNENQRA